MAKFDWERGPFCRLHLQVQIVLRMQMKPSWGHENLVSEHHIEREEWSRNDSTVEPFSCPQDGPLLAGLSRLIGLLDYQYLKGGHTVDMEMAPLWSRFGSTYYFFFSAGLSMQYTLEIKEANTCYFIKARTHQLKISLHAYHTL